MITGIHISLVEIVIIPFTSSKHHTVACLDTIFFDKAKKTIVRRSEKWLKIGTQADVVTVTKKNVVEGSNEDPKFLSL